jgi:hypothetical protein
MDLLKRYVGAFLVGVLGVGFGLLCYTAYQDHATIKALVSIAHTHQQAPTAQPQQAPQK